MEIWEVVTGSVDDNLPEMRRRIRQDVTRGVSH
jgi:hypothetical protein